jgi:hypothetical protein
MTWERREVTYVRRYWVVGERLLQGHQQGGWYVSSWSDSAPMLSYWVAGERFYQASINWVTARTIDLETISEIELDPERARMTLEVVDQWNTHSEDRAIAQATIHLAAA